jgi:hypothetical protein
MDVSSSGGQHWWPAFLRPGNQTPDVAVTAKEVDAGNQTSDERVTAKEVHAGSNRTSDERVTAKEVHAGSNRSLDVRVTSEKVNADVIPAAAATAGLSIGVRISHLQAEIAELREKPPQGSDSAAKLQDLEEMTGSVFDAYVASNFGSDKDIEQRLRAAEELAKALGRSHGATAVEQPHFAQQSEALEVLDRMQKELAMDKEDDLAVADRGTQDFDEILEEYLGASDSNSKELERNAAEVDGNKTTAFDEVTGPTDKDAHENVANTSLAAEFHRELEVTGSMLKETSKTEHSFDEFKGKLDTMDSTSTEDSKKEHSLDELMSADANETAASSPSVDELGGDLEAAASMPKEDSETANSLDELLSAATKVNIDSEPEANTTDGQSNVTTAEMSQQPEDPKDTRDLAELKKQATGEQLELSKKLGSAPSHNASHHKKHKHATSRTFDQDALDAAMKELEQRMGGSMQDDESQASGDDASDHALDSLRSQKTIPSQAAHIDASEQVFPSLSSSSSAQLPENTSTSIASLDTLQPDEYQQVLQSAAQAESGLGGSVPLASGMPDNKPVPQLAEANVTLSESSSDSQPSAAELAAKLHEAESEREKMRALMAKASDKLESDSAMRAEKEKLQAENERLKQAIEAAKSGTPKTVIEASLKANSTPAVKLFLGFKH